MLAIWSLVPLPLQNPACTSGSSWFTYCWRLAWRIWGISLMCHIKYIFIWILSSFSGILCWKFDIRKINKIFHLITTFGPTSTWETIWDKFYKLHYKLVNYSWRSSFQILCVLLVCEYVCLCVCVLMTQQGNLKREFFCKPSKWEYMFYLFVIFFCKYLGLAKINCIRICLLSGSHSDLWLWFASGV